MCTIAHLNHPYGQTIAIDDWTKGGFQVCPQEMGTDRDSTSRARPECTREKIFAPYERDLQPKNRNPNRRQAQPHAERLGIEAPRRKCLLNPQPSPELDAALVAFSEESLAYCKGINDDVAREYATEYARMIEQLLKGMNAEHPRIRHQLFAPSRRLICSTLDEMRDKYFPDKSASGDR
jgi:hypothetical protein